MSAATLAAKRSDFFGRCLLPLPRARVAIDEACDQVGFVPADFEAGKSALFPPMLRSNRGLACIDGDGVLASEGEANAPFNFKASQHLHAAVSLPIFVR